MTNSNPRRFRVRFNNGKHDYIMAEEISHTDKPNWVVFKTGGEVVRELWVGSLLEAPQEERPQGVEGRDASYAKPDSDNFGIQPKEIALSMVLVFESVALSSAGKLVRLPERNGDISMPVS